MPLSDQQLKTFDEEGYLFYRLDQPRVGAEPAEAFIVAVRGKRRAGGDG